MKKKLLTLLAILSSSVSMASEQSLSDDLTEKDQLTFKVKIKTGHETKHFTLLGPLENMLDLSDALEIALGSLSQPATLPDNIGSLEKLECLRILDQFDRSGCFMPLEGTLPRSLTDLETLRHLEIISTNLSGKLPSDLGKLSNLQSVCLIKNNITGFLPKSIGELLNLKHLYLQNNHLEGPIPKEFGNLTLLELLNLSQNNLCGFIPDELFTLKNLDLFAVNNNCGLTLDINTFLNKENDSFRNEDKPCYRFFFENTAIFGETPISLSVGDYCFEYKGSFINHGKVRDQAYEIYSNAFKNYDAKKERLDEVAEQKLKILYNSLSAEEKHHFGTQETFLAISKGFFESVHQDRKTHPHH